MDMDIDNAPAVERKGLKRPAAADELEDRQFEDEQRLKVSKGNYWDYPLQKKVPRACTPGCSLFKIDCLIARSAPSSLPLQIRQQFKLSRVVDSETCNPCATPKNLGPSYGDDAVVVVDT